MTEVLFVGTSDAFGAGGRRQSAILARGPRGAVLLDCGTTTNQGFQVLGVERDEIDTILVSHFHADHFGGVPLFVLAARFVDNRRHPLHVAGPPGIEERVRRLAAALGHPIDGDPGFAIRFTEIGTDRAYDLGAATVRAFETNHQPESHPHGYRLETGDATLSYTGDTGWFSDLPRHVGGSDLVVSECTQHTKLLDFHLSYEELLAHRDDFDCGRIVLTHLGHEMSERRGRCELETADDGVKIRV